MNGPLSQEALDLFTKHLSSLCGQIMVLDPEAYGHEIYDEHRGSYQWKVEGGRTSDYQGVRLHIGMNNEIYFIRHNRIDVIVRIHTDRGQRVEEVLVADVNKVLPSSFLAVHHEMMKPYPDPI